MKTRGKFAALRTSTSVLHWRLDARVICRSPAYDVTRLSASIGCGGDKWMLPTTRFEQIAAQSTEELRSSGQPALRSLRACPQLPRRVNGGHIRRKTASSLHAVSERSQIDIDALNTKKPCTAAMIVILLWRYVDAINGIPDKVEIVIVIVKVVYDLHE